jgi:hypothetical protein
VANEWLYPSIIIVATGAIAIALILLYTTRTQRKKKKEPPEKPHIEARESWLTRALKTEHTITIDEAKKAKDELKTLDLEREILSFAIRRLYEAQAEGKITEEEKERLAQWYKSRMMQVRDTITRSESVVALHELETMQEDLVKLFSERFDELSKKVEDMRTQLQLKPIEEETLVSATPSPTAEPTTESEKEKKKMRKRPSPTPSRKTEAEKRIEEIKAEVEKVLERLGQIEVEG